MIEVKELTKSYGPTLAVNQVSFEAHAGEVVGFIGPNGAGKTTTMRILTCYLTADAGSATVAGYDVLEHAIDVRKNVGYLPESAPLYADMGVVEYLQFMAEVRDIPKSQRKERIKNVVEICGLEGVIQKDIGELSKGYRQRVGLAQSLIHDPPILILDEPTSGLDPTQTIEIRNLIIEMGKKKLVLFSTHILPEVAATCSRILMINHGQIVANGSHEDLISSVRSEETLHLTVRGDEETITPQLKAVDGIKQVSNVRTDDGVVNYEINMVQEGHDASGALFQAAVQNKWDLVELRRDDIDLEDVFLHYSTGPNSNATTTPIDTSEVPNDDTTSDIAMTEEVDSAEEE